VSGSFSALNPEPSAFHLASTHLLDECSFKTHVFAEQDSDRRAPNMLFPIILPMAKENKESFHLREPSADEKSLSMSYS
jgi:hypothetical protein